MAEVLQLVSWWAGGRWRAYEVACGVPVTRVTELARATFLTRVVDLRPDEAVLWRGLRKSYRQDVEKVLADYRCEACGAEWMPAFQAMHARQAGRATRPDETWTMMADWVRDGHLVLVGGWPKGGQEPAGFAAFERQGRWAYYGHAATEIPRLGHALVWTGMLALKARGVERLEMGWQGAATDEKGHRIEFFRRGFGGADVQAADGEGVRGE